jgi:MFS family permease
VIGGAAGRPDTLAAIGRRHVALTALRWLPTGLLIPVLVVLMQERGLTLAEVGVVSATQGVIVLLLELPTGGLADALGRRPVLIVASVLDVASLALSAAAGSPGAFMVAWAVQGVYRALESGPLDAWFVDASQAVDPEVDIERGLGRAGTAIGLAIGAGALGSAGLASWWPADGPDPLVVPVLAALAVRIVDIGALVRLVAEPPEVVGVDPRRGGGADLRAGLAGVPGVVRRTVTLVARSGPLRALTAVELSWGAGLVAVELFSAPRLVELVGNTAGGVAAFALAAAAAWTVSALGAGLTRRVTAVSGSSPHRIGAGLRVVQGVAVALMAVVGGPVAMVAGYLAFYLVHGMANVVHYGLVHRLVGPEERTTVLSAHSLAARAGGIAAALGLGPVAEGAGIGWAMLAGAAVLAAAAPLYLAAGRAAAPSGDARHAEMAGAAAARR